MVGVSEGGVGVTPEERVGRVLELIIPFYRPGDDPKLEFQLAGAVSAAVAAACSRLAKVALELLDAVEGSGGNALLHEPHASMYVELRAAAGVPPA